MTMLNPIFSFAQCLFINNDSLDSLTKKMQKEIQFNFLWETQDINVVILGGENIGKSSLLYRFSYDSFSNNYNQTIGFDLYSKFVKISQDISVKFLIWDISGQDRFFSLSYPFLHCADVILCAYDCYDEKSFLLLPKLLYLANQYAPNYACPVIIGLKCDQKLSSKKVNNKKVLNLMKRLGLKFFIETSAKDGLNIAELSKVILKAASNSRMEKNRLKKDQTNKIS